MEFFSIRQIAEKWGLSKRRVLDLCKEDRIIGAMKVDTTWIIPADAPKPMDERIRSGKYIKRKDISMPDRCITRDDDWER